MEKVLKRRTRFITRFGNKIWKTIENTIENTIWKTIWKTMRKTIWERVVVFSNAYRFSKILHDVIGTSGGHNTILQIDTLLSRIRLSYGSTSVLSSSYSPPSWLPCPQDPTERFRSSLITAIHLPPIRP